MMYPDGETVVSTVATPATASSIKFGYYLSSRLDPVEENGTLWNSAFPLSRNPLPDAVNDPAGLTYGDYFTAVRRFLEDRQSRVIIAAIQAVGKMFYRVHDRVEIDLFLEKHGQFYHPCRVELRVKKQSARFVVNVALSSYGKSCIEREFDLLTHLASIPAGVYLPNVYGYGEVILPKGRDVKLFMGEWFDDFHEFHISQDPLDHQYKIQIWYGDGPPRYLTSADSMELYRQIAMILTGCYDPESFQQIYPWHHAAGDFIVHCTGNTLQVKLITARHYGALLENPEKDDATLLEAMLFFLANLSIRTRLDRLDGVGEVVWAGEPAVAGTVRGFMDGLASKSSQWALRFRHFLTSVSLSDFTEICEAIADSYHPNAPEISIIRRHLTNHATEVFESMMSQLE